MLETLKPKKFSHPDITANGKIRAQVEPDRLKTLWFNTGTLCNLECTHCYIESSPKNDRLVYITTEEVQPFSMKFGNKTWVPGKLASLRRTFYEPIYNGYLRN